MPSLWFSRSWLRPTRATAPQIAVADPDPIAPYLQSAISPALAASQRAARATDPRNGLAPRDPIAPFLLNAILPLLPLCGGPLGPRLRDGLADTDPIAPFLRSL